MRAWALRCQSLVTRVSVLRLMQGQHLGCGLVEPVSAVAQLLMRATALFAGVAGQLDTVDGKHRALR